MTPPPDDVDSRPHVPTPASGALSSEKPAGPGSVLVHASVGGASMLVAGALDVLGAASRVVSPVARFLLSPPLVPHAVAPMRVVEQLANRGERVQAALGGEADSVSRQLLPAMTDEIVQRVGITDVVVQRVDLVRIVDAVLDRIDLTELVLTRVDLDRVIAAADLDAAAAGLDVDAVAARLDIDAVVERMDLTELVLHRVDLVRIVDAVLDGIDLTELVVQRVDLVRIVDAVLDRIDLTELVLARVDLDRVIAAADLDAAAARLDVDAVAARLDIDAVVERMDLTELVLQRVDLLRIVDAVLDRIDLTELVLARVDLDRVIAAADLDAAAAGLDVDAVAARVDLVGIAEYIIDAVDLPEIIRTSTGSVATEAVRGARMQSIDADAQLQRVVDRVLLRRRARRTDAPGDVGEDLRGEGADASRKSSGGEP